MHAPATSGTAPSLEQRLGAWVRQRGAQVAPSGPGRWRLTPGDDAARPALVALDGDWIVVERALPGCRLARPADLGRWARRLLGAWPALPSGARPVLPPGETRVRMRAERPLPSRRWHSGDDACRWLEHALADVAAASARAVPEIPADAASEAGERDAATGPDLQALCELADWPATPRGGPGEVAVALPGRGGATCHAVVSVQGTRVRFQVTLEVCAEEDVSPAGRAAIALALLHLVAGVRLVRATATRLDERIAAHLEVDLELPLEPELAGHALSALAVAHQHVAAELGVLASDRALARAYLTVQGLR